jgi:protein-arginine kinase activator protein McsA
MKSNKVYSEYKKMTKESFVHEFTCPKCYMTFSGHIDKSVVRLDYQCSCGEVLSITPGK